MSTTIIATVAWNLISLTMDTSNQRILSIDQVMNLPTQQVCMDHSKERLRQFSETPAEKEEQMFIFCVPVKSKTTAQPMKGTV